MLSLRHATHSRRQQGRTLLFYGALVGLSAIGGLLGDQGDRARAGFLGLAFPGLGFLGWSAGDQLWLALGWFAVSLMAFGLSLLLWFGTGNLLAPPVLWGVLALVASRPSWAGLDSVPTVVWPFAVGPALWALLMVVWLGTGRRLPRPRKATGAANWVGVPSPDAPSELSFEDLQRRRVLFDRALQPAQDFRGFEWRDQFQTAAIRYQVNFLAYALAITRARHAPAADAYFDAAQVKLLHKIGDHRLWRYWRLENAWGRLRLAADPVPDQNIMYSGFTAVQMALSGLPDDLVLHRRGREWRRYSLDDIAGRLEQQYGASRYGLLACEPNWIYPLCNLITAVGIKASDARNGTARWPAMAKDFHDALRREGMRADGRFIAFRSALTGIAPPAPGGIVMQSFPCFFLNALDPVRAQEQWHAVRTELDRRDWHKLFWPIDVGNYGFSRAAGYAATAAAAAEMGDAGVARECLERIEAECPSIGEGGVIHRDRASLWAHCLETVARSVGRDGLRNMVAADERCDGPRLARATYPDVLIARAVAGARSLDLVLYPGGGAAVSTIGIAGLLPGRHYLTGLALPKFLCADASGAATIDVPLRGRTHLSIELFV
ncbi:linalool dehydratase/isomerase domain-containing protein [Sphingopyxis panaciterrae]